MGDGKMDDNTLKLIKEIAETAHKYIFGSNKDYENLEHYLEDFGVEVFYAELSDIDGYLRFNPITGRPRIVIKALQFPPRQRFTMAHEFGHLLIHHKWEPGVYVKDKDEVQDVTMYRGSSYHTLDESERERQANEFAGNFLMPENEIMELLIKKREELNRRISVTEGALFLSDEFKVSKPAAENRLKRLIQRKNNG